MVYRDDVVRVARSWLGIPFAHQHRAREVGVDCAGLVICVARELGLVSPEFDVTGYDRVPDGRSLRALCDQNLAPADCPEIGGVALVAWLDGPPQHVGIVVPYHAGGLSFVHAENRRHRAVIEQRLVFGRAMRLVAAYRFPGVV